MASTMLPQGEMMHHQQQAPAEQQQTQTQQPDTSGTVFIDTQHDDMVHDAQLDYYGCKLATASSDRTVKIYDVSGKTYTHTATLQGHEGPVWEVCWAHPKFGVVLGSCSFDGSVLLHHEQEPGNWVLLNENRSLHESSVNSISFAPHQYGLVSAAGSSDGYVSILSHNDDNSWTTDKFLDNPLGVNSVSWAPYEYDIIPENSNDDGDEGDNNNESSSKPKCLRLVTGGCDNRIRFWARNVEDGSWREDPDVTIGTSLAHTDWVRDVAWAPTSISNQSIVASCSEDGTVIIWTKSMEEGEPKVWEPLLLNKFDSPVWRLSWSITGNILAVSSGDGDVTLWKQKLDGEWEKVSTVDDVTA